MRIIGKLFVILNRVGEGCIILGKHPAQLTSDTPYTFHRPVKGMMPAR